MDDRFDIYLRKLRETPLDEHTEHTGRSALEALLNSFAGETERKGVHVQHEPKREADKGSPDFKIRSAGQILGYVEVKEIGAPLAKVLKSDQIKKYRALSDNIILTDYLDFIWIGPQGDPKTGVRDSARLAHPADLEGRTLRIKSEHAAAVTKLLGAFFSEPPQGIGRSQELALALASRSQLLRDFLTVELTRQAKEKSEGRLHALYDVFRRQVFHELTVKEFADAFAQMLAYGLFLARLNAGVNETVTLTNVREHIPGSFRLIRELVRFLEELKDDEYAGARWVVDEVLSIVNGLDLAAIQTDLSFRHRKTISRRVRAGDEEEHRLFERDPFIYFYEDYLKAYDPAMRKGRGVYYTPPPIVNFIVRAVDDVLKESFDIKAGLADRKRVTVLDFACGTGTFLLEVFERVFDNIGGPDAGGADLVVREHLTKNVFGFEYLIAPYTIAHLKLSQYLKDKGHSLKGSERLKVFLTNTLEPIQPQPNMFLPELAAETKAAQEVKERPILVIVGNPPYSGHSKNKGAWITASIAAYRDGFPELSKPAQGKWLQDDYVKFIRFAQMKMDAVEEGVVGIITNHSWLDNPTFKGMRKSLMEGFDQVRIIDLHGNAKKKERAPDGGRDENVFDIEQGVAITLLVKRPGSQRGVWHSDFWGTRLTKYKTAADASLNGIDWRRLDPIQPDWRFAVRDVAHAREYAEFWGVPAIFGRLGDPAPGFVTTHDEFAISFTPEESTVKINRFLSANDEREARTLFRLCSQLQWLYSRAKSELPTIDLNATLKQVDYRPFDSRWTIWDRNVAVHRRQRVNRYMFDDRPALSLCRVTVGEWGHVFAATKPADDSYISSRTKERGFLFPIYMSAVESFDLTFRAFLDARYEHHFTPEEILGYIYAVLHAPAYRSRYAEFLRIDFPRIPFPDNVSYFERLSALGWALVQAHLLRQLPRRGLAKYHGKGDHVVEAVRYVEADSSLHINATQSFGPVPQSVWDFHVGGYQVLSKYLKSRKGRTLSLDEIDHVAAVADSLAFTIDQMARIDEAYRAAFPGRG